MPETIASPPPLWEAIPLPLTDGKVTESGPVCARVTGTFLKKGSISLNNRYYSPQAVESIVAQATRRLSDPNGLPIQMMTSHGAADADKVMEVVGRIVKVGFDGPQDANGHGTGPNAIYEAEIANTAQGRDVATLISGGFHKSISLRAANGTAKVTPVVIEGRRLDGVEGFDLDALDLTVIPGLPNEGRINSVVLESTGSAPRFWESVDPREVRPYVDESALREVASQSWYRSAEILAEHDFGGHAHAGITMAVREMEPFLEARFQEPGHYTSKDRGRIAKADFGEPPDGFPIEVAKDVHDAADLIGKAADPEAVKARIIAIAKRKGFPLPEAWQDEGGDSASEDARESTARSDSERSALLAAALSVGAPTGNMGGPWIRDVFPDYFVYQAPGDAKCYRRTYTISDKGAVHLGDPTEVAAKTVYSAVEESVTQGTGPTDTTAGIDTSHATDTSAPKAPLDWQPCESCNTGKESACVCAGCKAKTGCWCCASREGMDRTGGPNPTESITMEMTAEQLATLVNETLEARLAPFIEAEQQRLEAQNLTEAAPPEEDEEEDREDDAPDEEEEEDDDKEDPKESDRRLGSKRERDHLKMAHDHVAHCLGKECATDGAKRFGESNSSNFDAAARAALGQAHDHIATILGMECPGPTPTGPLASGEEDKEAAENEAVQPGSGARRLAQEKDQPIPQESLTPAYLSRLMESAVAEVLRKAAPLSGTRAPVAPARPAAKPAKPVKPVQESAPAGMNVILESLARLAASQETTQAQILALTESVPATAARTAEEVAWRGTPTRKTQVVENRDATPGAPGTSNSDQLLAYATDRSVPIETRAFEVSKVFEDMMRGEALAAEGI